jgi:hypothetical protein
MRPGDTAYLRASEEPVEVLAIVDAAGTLLVRASDGEFQVARAEVMSAHERHGCGCCG